MNILVVGGAGYVGGSIVDSLSEAGHNILVYDILLYEESYRKNVPFVLGDIRDHSKLKKHLDWADVVIWLAALVGDPACSLNEDLTIEVNQKSVSFLRDYYKKRIFFMSTCSVYGDTDGILTEESDLNPLSLYAKTKLFSEKILEGSNALIFRLGTLYGLSDQFSRVRFDLVVNTLVMRAVLHGKFSVFGGAQYRPLLHVRDVAETVNRCLSLSHRGIYNLHSENTTIVAIAERIKNYFPNLNIEFMDVKYQDQRNYRISSDRAKKDLNFSPRLTIDDGIQELKQLLEQGRIKNSFLQRYSNYNYLKPLLDEYNSPLGQSIEVGF